MYQLNDKDYLKQLKSQLEFLIADFKYYNSGSIHFIYKISATLRTIFHDTDKSQAILPRLADHYSIKCIFRDKVARDDTHTNLYVGFNLGGDPDFNAPFYRDVKFQDYWNKTVYIEGKLNYTRKQLVLFAANKLGGSHVDPQIKDKYYHLIDGTIRLKTEKYDEDTVLSRVVYVMVLQTIPLIQNLIPQLESKIA